VNFVEINKRFSMDMAQFPLLMAATEFAADHEVPKGKRQDRTPTTCNTNMGLAAWRASFQASADRMAGNPGCTAQCSAILDHAVTGVALGRIGL
jgi:hypothetical protein